MRSGGTVPPRPGDWRSDRYATRRHGTGPWSGNDQETWGYGPDAGSVFPQVRAVSQMFTRGPHCGPRPSSLTARASRNRTGQNLSGLITRPGISGQDQPAPQDSIAVSEAEGDPPHKGSPPHLGRAPLVPDSPSPPHSKRRRGGRAARIPAGGHDVHFGQPSNSTAKVAGTLADMGYGGPGGGDLPAGPGAGSRCRHHAAGGRRCAH